MISWPTQSQAKTNIYKGLHADWLKYFHLNKLKMPWESAKQVLLSGGSVALREMVKVNNTGMFDGYFHVRHG